jgi:hypothetical protein
MVGQRTISEGELQSTERVGKQKQIFGGIGECFEVRSKLQKLPNH